MIMRQTAILAAALLMAATATAQVTVPEMVTIPAGSFTMGSADGGVFADEAPRHRVTFTKPFGMSAGEITNAQYEQFYPRHRALRGLDAGISTADDDAVVNVTYDQALAYCRALSAVTGRRFRLPTEAEWEYAARAGVNENMYPWEGELPLSEDKGCFYANFKPAEGNYMRDGQLITSRVGTYAPNDFGLYDMAGNVSEWTSTAYSESIDRMTSDLNPEYRYDAAQEDPYRMKRKIVRGGSWKDVAHNIRSDIRMWEYQNEQRSYIGFRCVRTQIGFAKGNKQENGRSR